MLLCLLPVRENGLCQATIEFDELFASFDFIRADNGDCVAGD